MYIKHKGEILMSLLMCTMLILGLGGCKKELKVGEDIKIDDITDFYFTYDGSTDPPYFQRYRFYTEEDKLYFYHEKREGDHWPLTEGDITVSGSKELTADDWDLFFDYLIEGKVVARQEYTDSGDGGPWTFLYWKKDKDKYQEFSFASYEKQKGFEEYCLKLVESMSE
jgi:hypothetical protein